MKNNISTNESLKFVCSLLSNSTSANKNEYAKKP